MNFAGVFAPIPTPFDDRDRVDTARLEAALQKWVPTPLDGFVVPGSNGEAALRDDFESHQAIVAARDAVPASRRFIVGTGRESTEAAICASKRAAEHGAEAVLARAPGFFKTQMTNDAFVRHYTAVADALPVPVPLSNFTAVTGVNLVRGAVERLATHSNIIGMKESGGDVGQIADLASSTPATFSVMAGSAGAFYSALCVGAVAGVLALACVLPDACSEVFTLTRAGRHDEALALRRIPPAAKLLGQQYGAPGLKAALNLIGYDVGVPRPPLAAAPEAAVAALREAIAQFEEIPA